MTTDEIRALVSRELGVSPEEAGSSLAYGQIPEWSSASHMNVILSLEEFLGIEFSSDEIVEMLDVPSIQAVLEARGHAAA